MIEQMLVQVGGSTSNGSMTGAQKFESAIFAGKKSPTPCALFRTKQLRPSLPSKAVATRSQRGASSELRPRTTKRQGGEAFG